MRVKPAIPSEQANGDVDEAVAYYLNEASEAVALGFIDALQRAYASIGEAPATGSPRWAHELNIPGVRTVRLKGYPWLVFYIELEQHIDVWRILHVKRDIPAWMNEPASEAED